MNTNIPEQLKSNPEGQKNDPVVPTTIKRTKEKVIANIERTKKIFEYIENIKIGDKVYIFKVSNTINEGICEFDEKDQIRAMYFVLKQGDQSYKFKVGISGYAIRTEYNRSNEDVPNRYLDNFYIRYIQMIKTKKGGPNIFSSQGGNKIFNFSFFKDIIGKGFNNDKMNPIITRSIFYIEDNKEGIQRK